MDKFSEVELKFDAAALSVGSEARQELVNLCMSMQPERYKFVQGADLYYAIGEHVVRYRHDADGSCLTVKRRKSSTSTVDREEVDLDLDEGVCLDAPERFLHAAGFKKVLHLLKDSRIFDFHYPRYTMQVALYDVVEWDYERNEYKENARTFLEMEIDKESQIPPSEAKKILAQWSKKFVSQFELTPVDSSLYEIYTGNTYLTTEEK